MKASARARWNPIRPGSGRGSGRGHGHLALLTAILLLGFALRIVNGCSVSALTADRFHADEALYAGWALLIPNGDPLLLSVPVDKPPLYLYTLAGSLLAFGRSEVAARLPSLASSVLGIAIVYRLGRRLYGPRGCGTSCDRRSPGLLAALFLALSPFDLLFARTAFTDSMLVLWVLAALWAVAAGRWFLSGVALGLAFATKQHALFLIPLVVAVGWVHAWTGRDSRESAPPSVDSAGSFGRPHGHKVPVLQNSAGSIRLWIRKTLQAPLYGALFRRAGRRRPAATLSPDDLLDAGLPTTASKHKPKRHWVRTKAEELLACVLGFALPFAGVVAWDSARWADTPSYWHQSASSYGGLVWAPVVEWGARLVEWIGWARYLAGSRVLGFLVVVGILGLLIHDWRRQPGARRTWLDTLFVAYGLVYVLAHTVLQFSIWDRYLLPLAPLLALLLGRIGQVTTRGSDQRRRETAPIAPHRLERVRDSRTADAKSATRLEPIEHTARGLETAPTAPHRSARVRDSRAGDGGLPPPWLPGGIEGGRVLSLRVLRVSVVALLLLSAWTATQNGYPIGGEHWAYQGLDQVTAYLQENAPPDAVLYHHWLRWHYTYYLYDTEFELRWWESGEHLRREALRTPERAQYIVLPDWRTLDPHAKGIAFQPLYETRRKDGSVSLSVYRIEPEQLASPADPIEQGSE